MAIGLTINHTSMAGGGPTQILAPDGATTIGQVVELFKEQTGITQRIRLRAAKRELRLTDTLDGVGIVGGHVLTAVKNTNGSPAYQALRRVELGISRQAEPRPRRYDTPDQQCCNGGVRWLSAS